MAASLMTMMLTVAAYGMTLLDNEACQKLSMVLSKLRFESPKARDQSMTATQANDIRSKAHEMGFPSIALAQALQFDFGLRQTEVIGLWVPRIGAGRIFHRRQGRQQVDRWTSLVAGRRHDVAGRVPRRKKQFSANGAGRIAPCC